MTSPRYWYVQAQVVQERRGYRGSMGVPTFVLDSWVQGLVGEDAVRRFAEQMLMTLTGSQNVFVSVAPSDFQPVEAMPFATAEVREPR